MLVRVLQRMIFKLNELSNKRARCRAPLREARSFVRSHGEKLNHSCTPPADLPGDVLIWSIRFNTSEANGLANNMEVILFHIGVRFCILVSNLVLLKYLFGYTLSERTRPSHPKTPQ